MTGQPIQSRASDTIFALASGPGRAAIAIIRLSGPQTRTILQAMCGVPPPRHASLRRLCDGVGEVLDQGLVLWMPGPASYTGEDSAELHLHGGRAVIGAVTAALLHAGGRPADAGEFTRRAFLAGRMSLLEAEAVADLSASETESQRVQALRQMQGGADARVGAWFERLTRCLAFEEALIDFPDDTSADGSFAQDGTEIEALLDEITRHIGAAQAGERVRSGLIFVIGGAPNVGKSSLFNALVGRDAAIVSARSGTTRDVLEATLELGGIAVTLVDTAGLRETEDEVEAEGVSRARRRIESADLVVLVTQAAGGGAADGPADGHVLRVASKCDLADAPCGMIGISTRTGHGLSGLVETLAERARRLASADIDPLFTRARHVAALQEAAAALTAARSLEMPELRAEELRAARLSLGRLAGRVDTEDVLDVIFGAFCIGK